MGSLLKPSEYCGPIRKKSYHCLSGIVDPSINDCYFDYEQAVLLRLSSSIISMIRSIASLQVKLGLVMEGKMTAI